MATCYGCGEEVDDPEYRTDATGHDDLIIDMELCTECADAWDETMQDEWWTDE